MNKHILEVTTEEENMEKVMNFIEEHTQGIDVKTSQQLMLIGEELSFNVFSYAYDDAPGIFILSIFIYPEERKISMEFRDFGKEYNPLDKQEPNLNVHFSERQIGGLGIMISKRLTDKQSYTRENGQNILTVEKFY